MHRGEAEAICDLIEEQGAVPNIAAKSNRKWKPRFSKALYRKCNLVERFFSRLKYFHRVASRYDERAENFLAVLPLAPMRLRRRAYKSIA